MKNEKNIRREIERKKSPKGGWTKAQLAEWGVKWPPPKGWKKRLTGKSTSSIKKSTSTNNPILPIDPPPNGWLRSKKGGIYKKTDKGTYAIFKFRNKWKTSFHSPNEGLTFFNINFDTIEDARSLLDTYSVEEINQFSKK